MEKTEDELLEEWLEYYRESCEKQRKQEETQWQRVNLV